MEFFQSSFWSLVFEIQKFSLGLKREVIGYLVTFRKEDKILVRGLVALQIKEGKILVKGP